MQFKEFLDYLAQNSTKPVLIDAVMEGLNAYTGSIQDRMYKYLKDLGYTGTLPDMIYQFAGVTIPDYWYAQFNAISGQQALVGLSSYGVTPSGYDDIKYVASIKESLFPDISTEAGVTTFSMSNCSSVQAKNGNVIVGYITGTSTIIKKYVKSTDTWSLLTLPYNEFFLSFGYANGYFYIFFKSPTNKMVRINEDFSDSFVDVYSGVFEVGQNIAYCEGIGVYMTALSGGKYLSSQDGIVWTEYAATGFSPRKFCAGTDRIISIGVNSNTYSITYDGVTFEEKTFPTGVNSSFWASTAPVFGNSVFVIPASSSLATALVSATGLQGSWTDVGVSQFTVDGLVGSHSAMHFNERFKCFVSTINPSVQTRIYASKHGYDWRYMGKFTGDVSDVVYSKGEFIIADSGSGELKKIFTGMAGIDGEYATVWHDAVLGDIYSKAGIYLYNDASQVSAYHWYKLDSDSIDYGSGVKVNGTGSDMTYNGTGGVFNGVSSRINFGTTLFNQFFGTGANATIELTFESNVDPVSSRILFNTSNEAISIGVIDGYVFASHKNSSDVVTTVGIIGEKTLAVGKKIFAAMVIDMTSLKLRLYVNGLLKEEKALPSNTYKASAAGFVDSIGSESSSTPTTTDHFFDGIIYNMKMNPTVRTSAQIESVAKTIGLLEQGITLAYSGALEQLSPSAYPVLNASIDGTKIIALNPTVANWKPFDS